MTGGMTPLRWMLGVVALIALAALLGPFALPFDHAQIDWQTGPYAAPGTAGHWLGTDDVGRDRLARLLVGTRVTLLVALAAALVSLVVGVLYGAAAGWIGGRVDEAMMRLVDVLYALPFMFIVIVLMVVFGRSLLMIFIGIGLVEWLTMARIVRAEVITLKSRPFILAARAAGAPGHAILRRHVLPNIAGIILAYLTLTLPQLIMVESFLSFLGLGVQEPLPSLGTLVKEGADRMDIAPLDLIVPGLVMVVLIACLTRAGETMRDRLQ